MVRESQNNRGGKTRLRQCKGYFMSFLRITLECFHSLSVYDVFKLFDSVVEWDLI